MTSFSNSFLNIFIVSLKVYKIINSKWMSWQMLLFLLRIDFKKWDALQLFKVHELSPMLMNSTYQHTLILALMNSILQIEHAFQIWVTRFIFTIMKNKIYIYWNWACISDLSNPTTVRFNMKNKIFIYWNWPWFHYQIHPLFKYRGFNS